MPPQSLGSATSGTHLLHIGRDGLLNCDQGKMSGLALPGAVTLRPWGWCGMRLSLCGILVSTRDHFFRKVWIHWVWLRVPSLDAFWLPGFFPGRTSGWMNGAESMNMLLNWCRDCVLKSQVPDLLAARRCLLVTRQLRFFLGRWQR